MLFRKKSDYQVLKDIILNNDNQASMDEAINHWQVHTEQMDCFIDELSEKYSELCMDHVPLAIESLYKSEEKIKTMIFCMLFEFTCMDIPYVTKLENLPMFRAKLEYIYHTLAEVFFSCFNGIGDCVGLIILNCDPEMSLAKPEEKQCVINGIQKRLELLYKYVSENGCDEDEVVSALSVTLDMAARLNHDGILVYLRKLSELQLDLRYLLETNQFLNRSAGKKISSEQLQYLLAYANWLVVLSDNADMCHFTEEESHIEVSFEYVVDVVENEGRADDFSGIEKRVYNDPGYNVRDEKIDLEFIDRAKTAFKKDMGIDLLDLYDFMTYLQISFNEENAEKKGANVYKILKKELLEAYVKERRDEITIMEVGKLLRCLVMIPEQLKTCRGKTDFYLPIGEVKNRKVKFEVMPIVEIDEWVIFSPITIRDIHDRWFHGLFDFMLPYEVELEELKNVIVDWKAFLTGLN